MNFHAQKVTVVGSGLTGLFAAYFLVENNYQVTVVEASDRVGGLIHTITHPLGLIETGANGILNSLRLEQICENIGLELVPSRKSSRKRYIFRDRPRRWPLTFFETLKALLKFAFCHNRSPQNHESVAYWSHRVFGKPFGDWLVSPALQGIYAGDTEKLSAALIFSRFFRQTRRTSGFGRDGKPHYRGTVAPVGGMGELVIKLKNYLVNKKVDFVFGHKYKHEHKKATVVLCVGAPSLVDILKGHYPKAAAELEKIEMLPVTTVTCFYKKPLLKGFGCLFPVQQKFNSLGVLFNSEIFDRRVFDGSHSSETWILGGALNKDILNATDSLILEKIKTDRNRLGAPGDPQDYVVTRWPLALPHYTLKHEQIINSTAVKNLEQERIFLSGNYTGTLGLSRILADVESLPARLQTYP